MVGKLACGCVVAVDMDDTPEGRADYESRGYTVELVTKDESRKAFAGIFYPCRHTVAAREILAGKKPWHWMDDVLELVESGAYVCLESPYKDETWRCSISHRDSVSFPDRSAMRDAPTPEKAWLKASTDYEQQVAHEDALDEERSPQMKRDAFMQAKADYREDEGR